MPLSSVLKWLSPRARREEKAQQTNADLRANAEKALRMKQEAGPQANIPPHQTANPGMQSANVNTDVSRQSQEGAFEPQLKRTKVARSGDT
jgi:hypothetical protein